MRMVQVFGILLAAAALLALAGCEAGSQAGPKSFADMYREEGMPVRTRLVEQEEFESFLAYHAVMSGIQQSTGYAAIADKVEKVYAEMGEYVEKDQVIVGFPTDSPSARYHQARVHYENTKKSHQRVEQLFNSGGVSRQELDNARAALDVAEADWRSVQQSVRVTAPISGYVTRINVLESDNVQPGDELFTISRTDRLKTTVWATDAEVMDIARGNAARAEWNGRIVSGRVVRVDMAKNQDRQAFGVVVEFDNPVNQIRLGVMAEIRITTYQKQDAVVVETKDLVSSGGRSYVYLARDGRAVKREVRTGRRQGLRVEVTDGLSPGDTLIVEGQVLLEDGGRINVVTGG